MDLLKILKQFNVEEEKQEAFKEALNKEIGTDMLPKLQYQKAIQKRDEWEVKFNELEAQSKNIDMTSIEKERDDAIKELETFKAGIETEKTNGTKKSILQDLIKEGGFQNEKIAKLLLDKIELDKIELEDNKVKDWENIFEPIKTEYADFITETQTTGTQSATPPKGNGGAISYTREQIENMTHEQIIANYDAIQSSLANIT